MVLIYFAFYIFMCVVLVFVYFDLLYIQVNQIECASLLSPQLLEPGGRSNEKTCVFFFADHEGQNRKTIECRVISKNGYFSTVTSCILLYQSESFPFLNRIG